MGETKLFQVCYEGELTIDVSNAMRRLGAEPNFDQSWHVWVPEGGHAELLVRYLRMEAGIETRVLIGCAQFTTNRDFLLIRHSLTPGADYGELHDAIARLGVVVDLPFESTFVVQSPDTTDVQTLGLALGELCPDDALMVTGISHDWAYSDGAISRMHVAAMEPKNLQFRTF
ncbi:MAG: hypothetical protein QOC81_3815 [Thermoanaerobaculia bacterium]|jgi:hypothetical protein|nr:hypothetical protein [Thermoanaerobaculia bacterium]